MDSTVGNFNESVIAAENDVVGTENTVLETGDAENDVTVTEDAVMGGEDTADGAEDSVDGDNGNSAGATDGNPAGAAETTDNQEEERNEDAGDKISEKKWPGWPGDSVFRILVPSHKVGGIIGRKGEFIKKICEESKARIKIIDAPQGAPDRAVSFNMRSGIQSIFAFKTLIISVVILVTFI